MMIKLHLLRKFLELLLNKEPLKQNQTPILPLPKLNSLTQLKILRITLESTEEFKPTEDLTTTMLNFIYQRTPTTKLLLKLIQHQPREEKKRRKMHQLYRTQLTHIKKRPIH